MLPNFFILGAPKCGTTSLAHWLSKHRDVFMCEPKEPRFFNTDFNLKFRPRSLSEYELLFEGAENSKAVGEASTGYLASKVAVQSILGHIDNPRFIVCLRPPTDMVVSLHAQRLKEGFETIRSVEEAWDACDARRNGVSLPFLVPDGKLLDYDRLCSLGEQVDRLLSQVSPDQVHFVLLEQLEADPNNEYLRICEFLGLELATIDEFSHQNKRGVPRWLALSIFLRGAGLAKRAMGIHHQLGIASKVNRLNVHTPGLNVDDSFRRKLDAHFHEDIEYLMSLTGLRLNHWIHGKSIQKSREK